MRPRGFPSFIALLAFAAAATVGACAANSTVDFERLPQTTEPRITVMLDQVKTVSARPQTPGYDRSCSPGDGCVFGPAWSDDHNGLDGHNGCDTRNDVLKRQLTKVVLRTVPRGCSAVAAGDLVDPYTGATIHFIKSNGGAVEIDHVYPLALAWAMGANGWVPQRRVDFANDQANLVATAKAINRAKSDKGPAEWLADDDFPAQYHCAYAVQILTIALGYDLPITDADVDAIRSTAGSCS